MSTRARWLAVGLALAATSAFAFGVNLAWWVVGEVAVGPFGARHCFGGECREGGLSWIGGTELWMRSGVAARAGGYIAMLVLVALAGALAAKRIPSLAARATIVAILTAGVSGGYFFAKFPGIQGASISIGLIMFVVGVVLGIAAAVVVIRASTRSAA